MTKPRLRLVAPTTKIEQLFDASNARHRSAGCDCDLVCNPNVSQLKVAKTGQHLHVVPVSLPSLNEADDR
jgi:hypothetical protein